MASEHGISYTEFSYMLLQANDYSHLHQHLGCELQIGGSDQWGNILSGVDLIRRRHGAAVHALCWPLLTAADGTKVGKTTGARVWLDPELTSPVRVLPALDQHRRRRAAPDAGAVHPPPDGRGGRPARGARRRAGRAGGAQRVLAREVTELVHGTGGGDGGRAGQRRAVRGRPRRASPDALAAVAAEVPCTTLAPGEALDDGVDLVLGARCARAWPPRRATLAGSSSSGAWP